MTPEQRAEVLLERKASGRSWHRPASHLKGEWLHVTAACYEHRHLIGVSPDRMWSFVAEWLRMLSKNTEDVQAWCLLPNHYHALVRSRDSMGLRKQTGLLHGRTSHQWNVEENRQGRTCFHGVKLKPVRSEAHRWSTLNYIHHNPVKHGYVERWQEWPFSSAHAYLEAFGREKASAIWDEYPITGMGKGWDEV